MASRHNPFVEDGGCWKSAPLPIGCAIVLCLWPAVFWAAVLVMAIECAKSDLRIMTGD